jgi:hypothetical protein
MWGWRRAKLPLDLREKVWVELCFGWLTDRLGRDHLLATDCVTPTPEYFPRPFEPTPACAQETFDRVCYFLGFEPGEIRLVADAAEHESERAALDQGPDAIVVTAPRQENAARFIADCARRLSKLRLNRVRDADIDRSTLPFLIDLLPALAGIGIFASNSVLSEQSEHVGYFGTWQMQRHGYLPPQVYGYALALRAWNRAEDRPAWTGHLRKDVRAAVDACLRYLTSSRDCLFAPGQRLADRAHLTQAALIQRLTDGTPTEQLAALWQLQSAGQTLPEAAQEPAARLLTATERGLRVESALALFRAGRPLASAFGRLLDQLHEPHGDARMSAALALGAMRLQPTTAIPELAALVAEDDDRRVVEAAAEALRRYGRSDDHHAKAVLRRLWRAVATGRGADPKILAAALGGMLKDARAFIVEERGDDVDDVWDEVLALVEHAPREDEAAPVDASAHDEARQAMGAQGDYGLLPILVPTLSPRPTVSWMFA